MKKFMRQPCGIFEKVYSLFRTVTAWIRAAKVEELQKKVLQLCKRYMEEIVTESQAEKKIQTTTTNEPLTKKMKQNQT